MVLRLWDLLSLPIFLDESIYLRWATLIFEQRTRAALMIPIAEDGKQPLVVWLTACLMGLLSDPLLAGRTVSALAGAASVLGIFVLGCQLGGRRTGLVAAILFAVAPYTLLFDRMALMDGFVGMTAVWSLCLGTLIVTRAGGRCQALLLGTALGVTMGAAVWTKMTGLFVLPLPLLCLLLVRERRNLLQSGLPLVVGYGLCAVLAGLMALMPDAENLVSKTSSFSLAPEELLGFPIELWRANSAAYGSWILAYLPGPLPWLVLASVPWGLLKRRRQTLILVGAWACLSIPPILTGRTLFTSRYLSPSVFPLLLLAALLMDQAWQWGEKAGGGLRLKLRVRAVSSVVGLVLMLAAISPSLAFDIQLLRNPTRADLVEFDRFQYVEGWPSGYGLMDALELVRARAAEIGGEVIVLTNHFDGPTRNGTAIYLRGNPKLHHHVDGHIPWGGSGIVEAWWNHQVPLLIIAADWFDDIASFERNVPEAERIGIFFKPGSQASFRVYLIDIPRISRPLEQ